MANSYLEQMLREAQYNDTRITSYSGRGMYGKECLGITGNESDIRRDIIEAVRMAVDETIDTVKDGTEEEGEEARSKLAAMFDVAFSYRTDSMGLDIVAYWPNVSSPDNGEE